MHIANLMTLGRFGRLCGAKPAMPGLSHASHSQCVALPLRDIRGNLLQASHYEDNPMSKTAARPQLPERRQEGGRGPQRAYDALMPL